MKLKGMLAALSSSLFFFLVCTSTEAYCSSSCGGINISHPFRRRDDPSNCGWSEYELICQNNRTLLNISSNLYDVKAISYENQTIRVVDPGLQSNNCSSSPRYSLTTQDLQDSGGSYALVYEYNNVMYVTCQQPVVNDSSYVTISPCINATNEYRYFLRHEISMAAFHRLCVYWDVPMDFDINGKASSLEIWSSLLMGFQLSWRTFLCAECEAAGGFCSCRDPYSYYTNDSNCCRNAFRNAYQTKHSFLNYLGSALEGFGLSFIPIAGKFLAARTALGMLCFFSFLVYKLGKQHPRQNERIEGMLRFFSFLIYKLRKQLLRKNESIELFLEKYKNLTPTRYSYGHIRKMTRGFKQKLGQGGFGSVYKGTLASGRPVAIKVLGKSRGNGEDFINEVATIGRIHHVNVVQLIGFCAEGSKRALVYDFMPNGSLDKYIYSKEEEEQEEEEGQGQGQSSALGVDKLYEIAVGTARGIEYLHRGCEMQILHFDIKPHNILLDANFIPKISDFGLARLYPTGRSAVSVTAAKGTIGYIAPELIYRNFGRISYKSDVYSFGRLVMEMIGRMNDPRVAAEHDSDSHFYFPAWLYDQLTKGEEVVVDAEIESESMLTKKLVMVGLWCIQISPEQRPSMHRVVEMLEGSAEDLRMPPRPSLMFPSEIEEVELVEIESSESSHMLHSSMSST